MYKINDVVSYQNYGVCRVVDIKPLSTMNQKPRKYYFLHQLYDKCDSTIIKIPVDTSNIMRPIMSNKEVFETIEFMKDLEHDWIKDIRHREAQFKLLIDSWEAENWAKVLRSVYVAKEENRAQDKFKSFPLVDTKYFERAENFFNQEVAYALNMDIKEVPEMILKLIQTKSGSN